MAIANDGMRAAMLASAVVICVVGATPAAAQERVQKFDIAAQPAADALNEWARQAGKQIVFPYDRVEGLRTPAVRGSLTPRDALNRLISSVGLTVTMERAGTISLASPGPTTALQDELASSEIVVTAQKKVERLSEVPLSVTVLTERNLNKLNATQFRDFANTVPALTFSTQGAGQTQISLRGVTSGIDISPTVGIYVDDVPYGTSAAFAAGGQTQLDVGLFDIDRIEVLRGPQGTLYGASTMGGLLKYVSKVPNPTSFAGEARVGLSSTHDGSVSYDGSAALNVPLVADKLTMRASGFYSRDGGYINNPALGLNDVNRSRIYGGRVDVLLKPADQLSIRLGAFIQQIRREGQATVDYLPGGTPEAGSLDQLRFAPEPFRQNFKLVHATIAYNPGPVAFTSITSYQDIDSYIGLDASRQYRPLLLNSYGRSYGSVAIPQTLDIRKFTQELRLGSSGTRHLEWLVGAYFTREKALNHQEFAVTDLQGAPQPNDIYDFRLPSTYKEYAGFGNLTYRFSDTFDISGGIRFSRNDQVTEQIGTGLLVGSRPRRSSSEDVITYLANARYHFNRRTTAYIRFATGYRPGGPNTVLNDPVTGQPLALPTFDADQLKSYEAGVKGETPSGQFSYDLAVYNIDWSNIQVATVRNGFGVRANAQDARIQGAELTLTARPDQRFTATGSFAYQDAELTVASPDIGGAKGQRLPNVPKFTAFIDLDWRASEITTAPTLGARLRFVSDRSGGFGNSPFQLEDYVMVDLRAGIDIGSIALQAYVRNLTDVRAETSVQIRGGIPQVGILQPRTIGLSASTTF